jgi:uncharacterized glyoxalase superfamily protein PhnB
MSPTEANGARPGGLEATRLAPGLTVNDLQRSVRYYTEGLGFEIADQMEEDGELLFVMLRAGAAYLGLGRDDFAKGKDRVKGVGMRFWLSTRQDVNGIADRAKAAGITLDSEPEQLPWGPLAFTLTDPDGFKLTISQDD